MPGASVGTIASFPTSTGDGNDPDGQLFINSNGDLFGSTVHGGTDPNPNNQIGTTYEITKIAGSFATTPTFLADIPTGLNTLVGVPNLSADANGDLFGLMITGGANHFGTIVEFPAGGGPEVQLANFTSSVGASGPGGRLLVDATGNLFGTTLSGGANGSGTVFEIQKIGGVYATTPTILASFGSGITPSGLGNLVEDAAGDLFGTTTSAVFEVEKTGASYAAPVSLVPFPVGTQIGTLTIDSNGDIFGTTIGGGANNDGTVFEIEKTPAGIYASMPTTLASFTAADGQLSLNHPKTLIVDSKGDLFGTTDPSAQNSGGAVFEIVKTAGGYNPTPTIVVNFSAATGTGPGANLVADANGDLFGTTQTGGANGSGTVFEITGSGFAIGPELTAGESISYRAGGVPGAPDPGLSISDPESATLVVATVSIGAGFLAGDTLNVGSPQTGITSSYDASTGVLTLSGSASLLAYQAALDSVTFTSSSAANPSRTITWSVNDGIATSAPVTSIVSVFANGGNFFNNNDSANIVLQNTNGQAAIWEMSGTNIIGGAVVGPNPGPGWNVVGTGDYNDDGHSDILWQSASGQAAIWEMSGTNIVGSGLVGPNPGSSWSVAGTGDFNSDGHSDVLWQNASGQVAIWDLNGTNVIGSGAVGANPGPSWSVAGTGDFNGDGHSDILLHNTSGQVAIWEMNGTNVIGSAVEAPNPGPSWNVIGTGDFYGNGHSDILFQNTSGQVAIWEMNGTNVIGGGVVGLNPGPSWKAVGTGDYNNDGHSDILFQNTSGQAAIWEMNGTNVIGGGVVGANPGPSWRA